MKLRLNHTSIGGLSPHLQHLLSLTKLLTIFGPESFEKKRRSLHRFAAKQFNCSKAGQGPGKIKSKKGTVSMKLRCFVVVSVLALAVAAFAQTNNAPTTEPAATPLFLVNGQPAALYLTIQSENGSEGGSLRLVSVKAIEGTCNLTTAPATDGAEKLADIANGRTLTAVAAAAPSLSVTSVITNYSGTAEVFCPASNPVLLIASCDYTGLPIMWDQKSTLPPGSNASTRWTHWLLPSAAAATGVHCQQPSTAFSSQVRLRCASIK